MGNKGTTSTPAAPPPSQAQATPMGPGHTIPSYMAPNTAFGGLWRMAGGSQNPTPLPGYQYNPQTDSMQRSQSPWINQQPTPAPQPQPMVFQAFQTNLPIPSPAPVWNAPTASSQQGVPTNAPQQNQNAKYF